MQQKPEILETRLVARSHLFGIEEVDLRFRNGVERTYERLRTPPIAAAMCVPLLDGVAGVVIREYRVGLEEDHLALARGALDEGEDSLAAANRGRQEEARYACRRLTWQKRMTL